MIANLTRAARCVAPGLVIGSMQAVAARPVCASSSAWTRHSDEGDLAAAASVEAARAARVLRGHHLHGHRHGPHAISLDGPNSASVGVPSPPAMCIGAESTPASHARPRGERRARARRAVPVRSASCARPGATRRAISRRSTRARARRRAVVTTGQTVSTIASMSAAVRAGGQHLNSQRDPACTCTNPRAEPRVRRATRRRAIAHRRWDEHRACASSSPGSMPIRRSASRFCSTTWRSVRSGTR